MELWKQTIFLPNGRNCRQSPVRDFGMKWRIKRNEGGNYEKIAKRSICLLLAFVCLISCCAITAAAASPVTGVASDQWKQALDSTKSKTSYYSPYMAASNSEEYYSKIGTDHLQGMCVDDDLRYIVTAAKERAKRHGDNVKVANSTWDTWKYKPQGGFSENGYPVADIPYLKCVCGNCKNGLDGKGDYIGYTKANGYDTDNMICCGLNQYMCMGLVSLGNGYWYWDGAGDTQDCLKLFQMDGFDAKTGAVGKAKNITDANLADYVAMETAAGTLTSTVEDAKRTLQTRVTKTEQNYPNNAAGYSDASWTALQNALSGAKAVLANSSATAEQADAAMETLKTALKGMRKTAAFEPVLAAAKDEITRMSRTLYGAYIAKVEDAIANSASYSQTKLDDCVTSLEPLRAAQNPTVAAEFDSYTENVPTNTSIDLKTKAGSCSRSRSRPARPRRSRPTAR